MNIIVTGGLGFIGSALIRYLISKTKNNVLNIDSITKVSMPIALKDYDKSKRYNFIKLNITNKQKLIKVINNFSPDLIFHLAAETHVDNSIKYPAKFIKSNILGTFNVLEACRIYLKLNLYKFNKFRLIYISTDEVYGSLKLNEKSFDEKFPYQPNSPYSASKASSGHLVRSWYKTFKLPTIITHCSNNYGPWQYHEKLIPLMILKGIHNKKMPIYGNGKNIRDWIFVEDHIRALIKISKNGKIGETYNIGSNQEYSNLDIVKMICENLDKEFPKNALHSNLIEFVEDRKGHDFRYSINYNKLKKQLNFYPKHNLITGIKKTVRWYIDNYQYFKSKRKI